MKRKRTAVKKKTAKKVMKKKTKARKVTKRPVKKKTTTKKAVKKKVATKKTAPRKKAAKKATGKKAAPGKRAAKKSPVQKAAKRKTAKKTTGKKTAGRRPASKVSSRRPKRAVKGMKRADLLRFEKELLEEKHRILRQGVFADELMDNQSNGAVGGSSGEYDAEMGSENYRRELASRLKSLESEALREIDGALRRINQGTYGICERCGRAIAKGRLEVVPHAHVCMKCLRGASGN